MLALGYRPQTGVKVGGNAVLRPAISAIWRSQASKSAFLWEPTSHAGNVVFYILLLLFLTCWQECEGYYYAPTPNRGGALSDDAM